jgi:hypothetical protein
VDFPPFVAGLVEGVFTAIVSASIQQMDDCGELVKSTAGSLNDFIDEVAEAGAGCLDGLCAGRAVANTGTASRGQHDTDASGANSRPSSEP